MCYGKIRPELPPSSLIKQSMTTYGISDEVWLNVLLTSAIQGSVVSFKLQRLYTRRSSPQCSVWEARWLPHPGRVLRRETNLNSCRKSNSHSRTASTWSNHYPDYVIMASKERATIYTLLQKIDTQLTSVLLYSTGMRRITTFRSTTDRIYDGGPIRL
jgi:hypothetical protein